MTGVITASSSLTLAPSRMRCGRAPMIAGTGLLPIRDSINSSLNDTLRNGRRRPCLRPAQVSIARQDEWRTSN